MSYLFELGKIALMNILTQKKKSLGSLLILTVSFISLGLFLGYISNIKELNRVMFSNRLMLGDFLVQAVDDNSAISFSTQKNIEKYLKSNHKINYFSKFLKINGQIELGSKSAFFQGIGFSIEGARLLRGKIWEWNTFQGHPLYENSRDQNILIGGALAKILNCNVNTLDGQLQSNGGYVNAEKKLQCLNTDAKLSSVTKSGQFNTVNTVVIGLSNSGFEHLDSMLIQMPLGLSQELIHTDDISFYAVAVNNHSELNLITQELNLKLQELNAHAIPWIDTNLGDLYVRTNDFLDIFKVFIFILLSSTIIISIFSHFRRIIIERSQEIYVLFSIGFNNSQIVRLFIFESIFLNFISFFFGIIIIFFIKQIITYFKIYYKGGLLSEDIPLSIDMSVINLFGILSLLIFLSMFSTLIAVKGKLEKQGL